MKNKNHRHSLLRLLCICTVTALCCLSASCSRQTDDGTGYAFTCTLAGNPECLDPQYTDNAHAETVLANITEGLLKLDEYGNILAAGAESCQISEDGLRYTFTLRNDGYWFCAGMEAQNAKPVTSKDYVFAFRRLLSPETHAPHAEDFLCIRNAAEVLAGNQKPEKLGISAPDGATVVFELAYPDENFLLALTQTCAVPCNEDFFLSTNGRYGLSEDMMLCNGAFYLTKWNYDDYGSGNFLTFRKNTLYHAAEFVSPSSLQFTIMRSQEEVDEDLSEKNTDCISTTTYPADYIRNKNYSVTVSSVKTWGLIFNPEQDTLQNLSFRQALASGIDRETLSSHMHENFLPAYGIIPPAVQLSGRSYRELYADEPLALPYEPAEAAALFDKLAIPMQTVNALKILIPDNFGNQNALLAVCQEWQSIFNQYIGIESVPETEYRQRLADGDYSIALYGFQPSYNSCDSMLQEIIAEAALLGLDTQELDTTLQEISDSWQLAEIVAQYGTCEHMILDQLVFIPLCYQNQYFICTAENTGIWCNPFSGAVYFQEAKHFSQK